MQLSEDTIRKFIIQELVLEAIKNHGGTVRVEWSNDFQNEILARFDKYVDMPYNQLCAKFRQQLLDIHNMNTPGIAKMLLANVAAKEDPTHFGPVLYLIERDDEMSKRF